MGNLVSAYIYPHPPIIIPEIGKGEEAPAAKTISSCIQASESMKAKQPDTVLVITPHGPAFKDAVAISVNETLSGNFARFGRPDVGLEFQNNLELTEKVIQKCNLSGVPVVLLNTQAVYLYGIDNSLDHGALVPMYYISQKVKDIKIVHICMGFLSYKELYEFGECIKEAIRKLMRMLLLSEAATFLIVLRRMHHVDTIKEAANLTKN